LFIAISANANNTNTPNPEDVTTAQFADGQEALADYISNNLVYPSCAREKAIEGTVKIAFFVLPDGSIHRPRVEEGINEVCDQVALNFVKNIPNWKPAYKNGEAVASKVKMIVNFKLEG